MHISTHCKMLAVTFTVLTGADMRLAAAADRKAEQILHVRSWVLTPSSQTLEAAGQPPQRQFAIKLVLAGEPSPNTDVTQAQLFFYPDASKELTYSNAYDADNKTIMARMSVAQLPAFLELARLATEGADVWCQWQMLNKYVDCHGGPAEHRR